MILVDLKDFKERKAWLELRKSGIGGSDAAVVCGISRYKSPVGLWMEKTGQADDQEDSEAAYWGRKFESIIREEFAQRTKLPVKTVPYLLRNEAHPFMIANIDGQVDDPQYGPCIFEAKTASAFKAKEWELEIPEEYYLQIQHYMAVTGYPGAYIASLIGGNRFVWKFLGRDEETIRMLVLLEERFWKQVTDRTPPPIDGSEASVHLLSQQYPLAQKEGPIDLGEEGLLWISRYETASQREKEISEKKNLAANQLKAMLKEQKCGYAGKRQVIWSNIESQRLDSNALKMQEPALYDKFLRVSRYRKLSIK